ncbi:MAG: family 16 glycoside hydrolase [Bryobacteraceae bacterium]
MQRSVSHSSPRFAAAAILALLVTSRELPGQNYQFQSMSGLAPVNVKAELATYRGRPAVRLLDQPGLMPTQAGAGHAMALLSDSDFEDGTIEADFAAAPRAGAPDSARGFAGIAFRIQPDGSHFECFYLRPTNGRAEDQLRRNHSTQYMANPDFPWERLRNESPGVYESYTDLEPGAWTSLKIVVSGTHARLYVNGAAQPCLIVNDLKLGKTHGKVALWIGPDTDAYFSRVAIKK